MNEGTNETCIPIETSSPPMELSKGTGNLAGEHCFINVINTRFIAARGGARISLSCSFGSLASWYKESEQDKYQEIRNSSRVHVTRNASLVMMQINKLQHTDNGVYHCMNRDVLKPSCGTELKVMGISTYEQVQSRHNVKDAIILIQTILLVLFVSIPVFLTQGKVSEWNIHNSSSVGGLTDHKIIMAISDMSARGWFLPE
uniref:Ig-like domain-containing protein n=1 Tax=Pseudonaja textilis TaxID=8673 RepID=A0A670YN87_PSETE